MSSKERIPQFLKVWFVAGPGLGFVSGLYLTYRQAAVAEKTYDCASGRVEAQLGDINPVRHEVWPGVMSRRIDFARLAG